MTTPTIPDSAKPKIQVARTRSPAYPSLTLEAAIEKARIAYGHIKRSAVPLDTMAAVWESNAKSSATLLGVSSLKKYGLLEDYEVDKRRVFKLTQSALALLLGPQDTPERASLIKQAALSPRIHAEIWSHFGGDLPSDVALKQYLLLDKSFNDSAVDAFIKSFRETISFAQLTQNDIVTSVDTFKDDTEDEQTSNVTATEESVKSLPPPPQIQTTSTLSASSVVLREFNFPLPTGTATVRVPFPLTEEDYDSLIKTLRNFRDGLVKKDVPQIDLAEPGSQVQAEALASSGIEFNFFNFSYSHDIDFATKLAKAHGFKIRLDLNKGLAILRKSSPE
jgi:hypothetical protein